MSTCACRACVPPRTSWAALVVGAVLALAIAAGAASAQPEEQRSRAWLPYAQSLVAREQPVSLVLLEDDLFSLVLASRPAVFHVSETRQDHMTRLESSGAQLCRDALRRPIRPMRLRGRPLSVLFDLVTQDPTASSRVPPGVVGGSGSSARGPMRIAQVIDIVVDADDTLETSLDRLVSSGLPLGWGVIERPDDGVSPCQIVLVTEDTVLWTPYDALLLPAPLPPKAH